MMLSAYFISHTALQQRWMKHAFLLGVLCTLCQANSYAHAADTLSSAPRENTPFLPTVHHPNIEAVTLFATNPDIVTPVGIAVSPDGRVFVQENHTHKRTKDYEGPKTDRILIFEDTDGDGGSGQTQCFLRRTHL